MVHTNKTIQVEYKNLPVVKSHYSTNIVFICEINIRLKNTLQMS